MTFAYKGITGSIL